MPTTAVFIVHKCLAGQREQVRAVWSLHMASAVQANPDHLAYFYCVDNDDPDAVCAFQQYASAEAASAFLNQPAYQAYLKDVEPLLAGPPEIKRLSPVWQKSCERAS